MAPKADPMVAVTFQAQQWIDDLPAPADRDPNSAEFELPLSEVTHVPQDEWPEDEYKYGELLPPDDSLESDVLAEHKDAPDWVNEWVDNGTGPFYVTTQFK